MVRSLVPQLMGAPGFVVSDVALSLLYNNLDIKYLQFFENICIFVPYFL